MAHDMSTPTDDRRRMLEAITEEVALDLYFLDSLAGNGESEEADPYRVLLDQVRADVAQRLSGLICERAERQLTERPVCPCVAERRERARRELAALDVFTNSTACEEYRPS